MCTENDVHSELRTQCGRRYSVDCPGSRVHPGSNDYASPLLAGVKAVHYSWLVRAFCRAARGSPHVLSEAAKPEPATDAVRIAHSCGVLGYDSSQGPGWWQTWPVVAVRRCLRAAIPGRVAVTRIWRNTGSGQDMSYRSDRTFVFLPGRDGASEGPEVSPAVRSGVSLTRGIWMNLQITYLRTGRFWLGGLWLAMSSLGDGRA